MTHMYCLKFFVNFPTLIVFSSNLGHFPIFPKLSKIKSDVGHHPQKALTDFGNTCMIK